MGQDVKTHKTGLRSEAHSVILAVKDGNAVCPICGGLTRVKILPSTRLIDYPLYCHRCRHTTTTTYRGPERERQS